MQPQADVTQLLGPVLGQRIQLGHVVSDLDAALAFWTGALGVGPFVVIDDPVGTSPFVHRGEASDMRMTVAFSHLGDAMVELICQTNDAASPYREFLSAGRSGLHHLGFWPVDMDLAERQAAGAGFREVSSIILADGTKSVSYLESPQAVGIMIELIRPSPFRETYARGIRALSRNWSGECPIRRFASFADFVASEDCREGLAG